MSLFTFLGQVFLIASVIFLAMKGYAMTKDYLERGKKLNELERKYEELRRRRKDVAVRIYFFL